jgi:peptidoglycan/LPS O-acetylase OafA/YrhL
MLAMFWPYRPREGFPVVPRWLMIVLLIVGIAVYVALVSLVSHRPDYGPAP